jgi:chromosome segregation ATPase
MAAVDPTTDPREVQLRKLAQELAVAREDFRKQRAKQQAELAEQRAELASRRAEVGQLQAAARADRYRARNLYKRLKARSEAEAAAAVARVAAERVELERREERLTAERDALTTEREEFAAHTTEHQARLQAAWDQLTENQRRLLADREQAEAWIASQTAELDRRGNALDERQTHQGARQAAMEARSATLVAEIAGLEARALNTRSVLKHLEERRARLEVELAGGTAPASNALVLDATVSASVAPGKPVDRLLTELQAGEQQLHRDRAKLSAVEAELVRREGDIGDQRAILAEQVAALMAARQNWQSSELSTVGELESLATALRARELAADERERLIAAADRGRREKEQELWELRTKVETWQSALTDHEASLATHRGRVLADLLEKRQQLVQWEVSLDEVARAWGELRAREQKHLADELADTADTRERYTRRLAEVDKLVEKLSDELNRIAPMALAAEEAVASGTVGKRRVKAMRKRWERMFARLRSDLDARRVALSVESLEAEERTKALREATADLTARMGEAAHLRRETDLEQLASGRATDELDWSAVEPTPAEGLVLELCREVDDLAADILPMKATSTHLARVA